MIGTVLSGRYEITGELGRGGMGVVYKARDPLLQREVAIKMIPPSALDGDAEERIQREARPVARLDHPGIVPIHDLGRHEDSLFLVMPLVQGVTVRRRIRDGSLTLGEVLETGAQAARALAYSHSHGIVHRDVKPSNVLVAREGELLRVRLMDFGLAQHTSESRLTRTGNLPGTLSYLSPEQVQEEGDPPDGRADLYALAVLLYECLAGEPPFSGTVYATLYRILHEPPQSLRARGLDVDPRLDALILRCLSKDRRDRPASGDDLATELEDHRRHLSDADRHRAAGLEHAAPWSGREQRELPLLGRHAELAALQERLTAAFAGECQLVILGGEAGTGKTRLLQELEGLARSRQVRVLRGRFSDLESAFPYQGLCELIQDYFRGAESRGSSGAQSQRTEPEDGPDLGDLAPDLVSLFPELSEIPELRQALETSSPRLAEELRRHTRPPGQRAADPTFVFEVLARTLGRLADGRPLVLTVENLHAADVALDAVQYLARRLGPTPILLVGTYRRSEVFRGHPLRRLLDGFADDPRFLHLELENLQLSDVLRLVEVLVGSKNLRVDLVERIYEATEGNPFFCQEMTRSLLETGAIERDETGAYCLAEDVNLGAGAMPATIQQAEERRIERLAEGQRRLLSVAAVLGKSFELRDLEALLRSGDGGHPGDGGDGGEDEERAEERDRQIDELIGHGILLEDRKARGDRLTFASGLVRDLLYRELSRRRRRTLHRRYARRLEQIHAGRLERVLPRLVDHFRAADEADATVRYGLDLARRSLETFSSEDALRAARIALEFVEEEEVDDADRLYAELEQILATAYRDLGNLDRALREAESSADAWERLGDEEKLAETALLAAEVAWQGRRMDRVRGWVERGAPAARRADAHDVLRRLLELGVTVTNLRGERADPAYVYELRSLLEPREDEADGNEASGAQSGGTLVSALLTPLSSVDPASFLFMEEWEVAANVFETLLEAGSDGLVVAGLCDKWSSRGGGRSFHLTLRPNLEFSDGTPLDAAAVKRSLERNAARRDDPPPPAFAALEGFEAFRSGEAPEISGIEVDFGEQTVVGLPAASENPKDPEDGSARGLLFRLSEPLPIFPSLLTDLRTAVTHDPGEGHLRGSGPFRFVSVEPERVVLERNPRWQGDGPYLDRLEFRVLRRTSEIADGLRRGEIDVGRDLRSEELEELLRLPRLRGGLVETVKKNSYFALFNPHGPETRDPVVRRVLASSIRTTDLVWRTLGRFAMPAVSLIPPGILGHDAGRRPPFVAPEQARELLRSAGRELPLKLSATVHPLFRERFGSLLEALVAVWAECGLEVEVRVQDLTSFVRAWNDPERSRELDLLIVRWNPAYDDPDNFTWALLNGESGLLRRFFDSPEGDEILEAARREERPAARQALYRQFEDLVEEDAALLPLFHDIDYRLVGPGWRGVRLRNTPPYVSYSEISQISDAGRRAAAWSSGGEIHVATPAQLRDTDPAAGHYLDHHEVMLNVFETLTRLDGQVRVRGHLAESFDSLDGARAFRFRLRRGVRFHDGRRLTARDVRYSFERLIRRGGDLRYLLRPIRGARELAEGTAQTLEGLRIESPHELVCELERPLGFFPVLLAHPATAIVPEESRDFHGRWRDGCCGTGPFRVVSFVAGERLDTERYPGYWRDGLPRCERLVFHRQPSPERILDDFRAGRLSLASHLRPEDLEALRRDASFDGEYAESPGLTTYFLATGARHGPLAAVTLRRALFAGLDVDPVLRDTLGRVATPAHGLVPPGLLGHEAPRTSRGLEDRKMAGRDELRDLELTIAVHPAFVRDYDDCSRRLVQQLEDLGLRLEIQEPAIDQLFPLLRSGSVDLFLGRWAAVYPDADCFFSGLWQAGTGFLAPLAEDDHLAGVVEEGREEIDPALRHAIYRSAEDHLIRRALLLPLFHEQSYRFAAPGVRGLRLGITLPTVYYEELSTGS